MQQILASTSKVMMDYRGSGNLLYLPLEKLMQGAAAPSTEPSTAPRPATPEAVPDAARSRDTLRSRERGER